jgi:hypothetical protein
LVKCAKLPDCTHAHARTHAHTHTRTRTFRKCVGLA